MITLYINCPSTLALNPCKTRCSYATKVGKGHNTQKIPVYIILVLLSTFHSHGRLAQGNDINRRISGYAINMVSSLHPRNFLEEPDYSIV